MFVRAAFFCMMQCCALCLFVACGNDPAAFRLEGKFLNFNQGELHIYSLDRGLNKKDTIRLSDGRFAYEMQLRDSAMFSVIFPNYSEIPIYARPGDKIVMEGDASHLREVEVKGTEENELLTQFRMKVNDQTPPEVKKSVHTFVKDHPTSPLCRYLIDKYLLLKPEPDYEQAYQTVSVMSDADPKNDELHQLKRQIEKLKSVRQKSQLPSFSAVSIAGLKVSEADLKSDVNVLYVWASWNFNTLTMQRELQKQKKNYGSRLAVVGLCLDGSLKDCREALKRDSVSWPIICDGKMWQSPVVTALSITDIPSNFVTDRNGRILARDLDMVTLRGKIDELMKQ